MKHKEEVMLTKDQLIRRAIWVACSPGGTRKDEEKLALIEAFLRDALGQDHGVWRWRVNPRYRAMPAGNGLDDLT
jgi:hypothetical protein